MAPLYIELYNISKYKMRVESVCQSVDQSVPYMLYNTIWHEMIDENANAINELMNRLTDMDK